MSPIVTYQNKKYNRAIASTQLPTAVFDSMTRCAELEGYNSVSSFLRDAIIEKCQATTAAMQVLFHQNKVKVEAD